MFESLATYLRRTSSQRGAHARQYSRNEDWQQLARMGILEIGASGSPEQPGNTEMLSIVSNLLGHHGVRSRFQTTAVLANQMLKSVIDRSTRERLVAAVGSGVTTVALAHSEKHNDYALHDVGVTAESTPQGWRVSGHKVVVIDGDADLMVVSTRTSGDQKDPNGVTLLLIDPRQQGVERRLYGALDGSTCADVSLDGVLVGAEMQIGRAGNGHEILVRAVDQVSVTMCAEAVGAMEAIFDQTRDYLKLREQFGSKLASFQVLQHRLVDMWVMLEQARSLTWAAARGLDRQEAAKLIPAAKIKCIESGRMIGESGIQMHGGMGMTDEISIGHLYKRILAIEHSYGDRRFQLKKIAVAPETPEPRVSPPKTVRA